MRWFLLKLTDIRIVFVIIANYAISLIANPVETRRRLRVRFFKKLIARRPFPLMELTICKHSFNPETHNIVIGGFVNQQAIRRVCCTNVAQGH